jgi:putative tryptophan/tyrosine transport system substrate-binding protein
MMLRRDLLSLGATGALAFAVAPQMARAQQPGRVYRMAFYTPTRPVSEMTEESSYRTLRTFLPELRRLGFIEGRNLVMLRFSAEGYPDRTESIARDIIRAQPDIIVSDGGTNMARILLGLTDTIPIVLLGGADWMALGLTRSLARPGRNLTGFATAAGLEMHGKRLQFLKEAVPGAKRLAYLGSETSIEADRKILLDAAAGR